MKTLLSPMQIGTCKLKNRFMMTAASLNRSPNGDLTADVLDFYTARAKGGAGLLIAGAAGVDPVRRSKGTMMQICDDSFIPQLQILTDAVHKTDSKIFLQLLHPGAYASPLEYGTELPPIAPSAYISNLTRAETHAMTAVEIRTVVGYFADAAARTKAAGFDGVELCASVGYLIAEFLSSATNHREDEYGGPLENRMRFLLEIVDAVKAATGTDFPLMVRLSGEDFIPNGNTLADAIEIAKALEKHGVDGISVTGGWHESRVPQITGHVPHGGYAYLAKGIKEAVSIPVAACNRMDIASGEEALANGSCDFVGLCRPFLADANLVQKLEQGREKEIHKCLSCNQECLDRIFAGKPVGCTLNPQLGAELSLSPCKDEKKNILVVGAGISGMAYAALAANENNVTIIEKSNTYGGAGKFLATLPAWTDCGDYVDALYEECLKAGVQFKFNCALAPQELENLLAAKQYDQLIIACGAELSQPKFPVTADNVHLMTDFYGDKPLPEGSIAIVGNDFRALEFALRCAETQETICIGAQKKAGGGMAKSVQWVALGAAKKAGISMICEAEINAVTEDGIHYTVNGEEAIVTADHIILAHGWTASPALQRENFSEAYQDSILWIGDGKTPGRITEAVRSAAEAAVQIAVDTTRVIC